MTTRRMFLGSNLGLMAALAMPAVSQISLAQTRYPDRPIRVIVPFGPGGLADVTMRVVAEKLGEKLGQQVVVVNQPGAGGSAAARAVLSNPADGYTLALFTNGTAISVPLVANLGYDPIAQFVPVSSLGFFDFVFATSAEHEHKTLADFVKAAKAKAGALNIGTINIGSTQNLSAVLFKGQAGIDATVVPFRTTPDAITALLRKDVDLIIDGYVATKSLLADGKLRALATTGATRFADLPDTPTVRESGFPDFEVTSWNGVFAPSGTPETIIRTLNEALASALAETSVKQRLIGLGIEAKGGSPSDMGAKLKADIMRWGGVIEKAGIAKQ